MGFLAVGCGSGLSGPSTGGRCGFGIATEDIIGQCRATPTTMGAFEVTDSQGAAAIPAGSAAQTVSEAVRIAWQPFPGDVSGYQIYFGRSAATANRFVSNLPTDSGSIDPTAPAVTYDAARDLGLSRGDTACFRIYGYDFARTLTDQSRLVCTVV